MPWTKDKLERKEYARQLDLLIKNADDFKMVSNNSLVIALNARYGSGKTTFVNMWSNHLKSIATDAWVPYVAHYNTWENDDYENPLVPFISVIDEFINELIKSNVIDQDDEKITAFRKASLYSLARVGKKVIDSAMIEKLGIGFDAVLDELKKINDDYNESIEKDYEMILNDFKQHQSAKKSFKDALESITHTKPLLVFIDELDRCKPLFAIKTLEILKHFFDVPNLIYVISVDLEQLAHSVKTIYGANMDASGYLRRFFDTVSNIPVPSASKYLELRLDEIGINDIGFRTFNDFSMIANFYQLTIRDIDTLIPSINLLVRNLENDNRRNQTYYERQREVMLFLLVTKFKTPELYNKILKTTFSRTDVHYPENSKNIPLLFQLLEDGNNKEQIRKVSDRSLDAHVLQSKLDHFFRDSQLDYVRHDITIGQYLHNKIENITSLFNH